MSSYHTRYLIFALLFIGAAFFLRHGLCVGNNCVDRHAIVRTYYPDNGEFRIQTPTKVEGKTYDATHVFKLGDLQTIDGLSFGYDLASGNNEYGNDAKLFYLTPEGLEQYRREYLNVNLDCPAWFMHHHSHIYILVGVDDAIIQQLRNYKFVLKREGVPFSYQGHVMTYDSTYMDGGVSHLYPPAFERAFSNVGTADIPYTYFLVTGINAAK